jgi:hypothetical protein
MIWVWNGLVYNRCETAALERYLTSEIVAKSRASLDPRVSTRVPSSSFAPTTPATSTSSASDVLRGTAPPSSSSPSVGLGLTSERDTKLSGAVAETGIHLHVDEVVAVADGDEKKALLPPTSADGAAVPTTTSSSSLVHEVKVEEALHPAEKRSTSWVEFTDSFAMIWGTLHC